MTKTKGLADKDVVQRSLRGRVVTVKPNIQKKLKKIHRKEKSIDLAKDRTFSLSPAKFPIVSLVNETFLQDSNKKRSTNNIHSADLEISKISNINKEGSLAEPSCKNEVVDVSAKNECDENKLPRSRKKKNVIKSLSVAGEKTISFGGINIIPESATPVLKNRNSSSIEESPGKSKVLRVSVTPFDAVTPNNISKCRRFQSEPKENANNTTDTLKIPLIKTPHILKGSKPSLRDRSNAKTPNNKISKSTLQNKSLKIQTPSAHKKFTVDTAVNNVPGPDKDQSALKQANDELGQKSAKTASCCRKMPNFAELHRRNFAQMESLLDHAKRKADRAFILLNTPGITAKSNNAVGAPNRMYNRFGYKSTYLTDIRRSAELKEVMKARAPIVISRQEKHIQMSKKIIVQTETSSYKSRNILKGVRLNKRFDLQMKYRNCN